MSGSSCAVYGCKNSYYTARGQNIIYHAFPKSKDLVSRTIRSEWIHRCRRKDKFNPDTGRICSVHFVQNDYERDLQNELLGKNMYFHYIRTYIT